MKKIIRSEEGFTLIEIIAVLVILGVLAAVAVPKYLNLMEESKTKAGEGALAAAASNVSIQYGSALLDTAIESTALTNAISNCNKQLSDLGDYSALYANTAGDVTVTAWNDDTTSVSHSFNMY